MKRIFISHSCKDRELEESGFLDADPAVIPDERLRQLRFAQLVRDEIADRLETTENLRPLLDRRLLKAGDAWPLKLNQWLGNCDAAILILTPQALQSDWVKKEANILCWRFALSPVDFLVIPVCLFVTERDIERGGFGPTEMTQIQIQRFDHDATHDAAVQIAAEVVGRIRMRFSAGVALGRSLDGFCQWVGYLVNYFKKLEPILVEEALGLLGVEPHDPDLNVGNDGGNNAALLARELLLCDRERRRDVVAHLAMALRAECGVSGASDVYGLIAPAWVGSDAATGLLYGTCLRKRASHMSPLVVELHVPPSQPDRQFSQSEVILDYVRRAYCCAPGIERQVVDLTSIVSGEECIDDANALNDSIVRGLEANEILLAACAPDKGWPVIVVTPERLDDKLVVETLGRLEARGIRRVDFVYLAGGKPHPAPHLNLNFIQVRPALEQDQTLKALGDKQRLRQYLVPMEKYRA